MASAPSMTLPLDQNTPRPAAFFDRDGVINLDHGYVGTTGRFELVEGAAAAIRACHDAGYLVFVVTNQSGVARGYFDKAAVSEVHAHMKRLLAADRATIDDVRACLHHVDGVVPPYNRVCGCRKPQPGMILDLMHKWPVDPASSFLVGDKNSDMAAAKAAGIAGYLFDGGNLLTFVRSIIDGSRFVSNLD